MGGEIQVESQVDEGSRFWFDLALPNVGEMSAEKTARVRHPSALSASRSDQRQVELLLPPLPDRIAIYESARLGDMHQVEIEANRLARESEIYRPFAEKVLALAANFNDAAIQALAQPDIETDTGAYRYDA